MITYDSFKSPLLLSGPPYAQIATKLFLHNRALSSFPNKTPRNKSSLILKVASYA